MSREGSVLIPWEKQEDHYLKQEAVKWSIGNSRYEIYTTTLEDIDVGALISHCLAVKYKIRQAVTTPAHFEQSLFRVFPRTLSNVLRPIWDVIVSDQDEIAESEDGFEEAIKEFIATHADSQDRHELVKQLRTAVKPMNLSVQAFYYRLLEINQMVVWLPGNVDRLDDNQLKHVLHDAMPETWRDRFMNAGNSIDTSTLAQVLRYFRQQENRALRKARDNSRQQKKESKNARSGRSRIPSSGRTSNRDSGGRSSTKRTVSSSSGHEPYMGRMLQQSQEQEKESQVRQLEEKRDYF